MSKNKVISISGVSIVICIILFIPVRIPYTVYGTGKIFAINEWVLGRTSDGRITSTIKNNQMSIITAYGGKEFQQRDIYNFFLDPSIGQKKFIMEGERVGYLQSTELERQLIMMRGELEVEKAMLGVSSTGQKPEAVVEAKTNLQLAKERLEIEEKLFIRSQSLFKDTLISAQEFEVSNNRFQLAKLEVDLAKAKLLSVSTGEKPEEIVFARKRILALENQVKNLEDRMQHLTITAPFSGMMQYKKGEITTVEPLVNLLDTSAYIIIAPIRAKELNYVKVGQKAYLKLFSGGCQLEATISNIDNGIQVINGKQAAYITAIVNSRCEGMLPGLLAQTVVHTDHLTPLEYLQRVTVGLFYR